MEGIFLASKLKLHACPWVRNVGSQDVVGSVLSTPVGYVSLTTRLH